MATENLDYYPVSDWDNAYENLTYIPDAESYIPIWQTLTKLYREASHNQGQSNLDISYGPTVRQKLDIFRPRDNSKGLIIFIHGGYWMMSDKNDWSHLAEGAIESGYTFAIPSYSLCPKVSINDIIKAVALAIEYCATHINGEIRLLGHSLAAIF